METITPFIENYWWAMLLGAVFVLSLSRASLRVRPSPDPAKVRRGDTNDVGTDLPFRRSEFATKAEIVRRERVKGSAIVMVILLVGFPTLAVISRRSPTPARGSLVAIQTIMFAAGIASLLVFTMRGNRLARRSGLICPACGTELVGWAGGPRLHRWSLQDRVLETGKCPRCGAQLLDPTEVGSVSETLTGAENARRAGLVIALIAGLIAMVYFAVSDVSARRRAYCADRYARAYSPEDSIAVDSTRAHRQDAVTCGDLRRPMDR